MWFYKIGDLVKGPVELFELASMVVVGAICGNTPIRRASESSFRRLGDSELATWLTYGGEESNSKRNLSVLRICFNLFVIFGAIALLLLGASGTFLTLAVINGASSLVWLAIWFGLFLGTLFLAASSVFWGMALYRMWMIVPPVFARTTPGVAVGLFFVPFFNLYWVYRAFYGLASDLEAEAERENLPVKLSSKVFALIASVGFDLWMLGVGLPFAGIFGLVSFCMMKHLAVRILLRRIRDCKEQVL
ncbi:MAG: hypothetical protein PHS41_11115 [Victivallaceae bacterium]|nr:hypothetical protein [Victivallaceae bacterium]